MNRFKFAVVCVALSCFAIGCDNTAADKTDSAAKTTEATPSTEAGPDMAKLKTDIQALETSWAVADNARDTNAVAAFYADDAVTFANNKPMMVGKEAIYKDVAAGLAKRAKGTTVAYDVMDVFGNENTVTETGKITVKDTSGKVTYTGKYMAVWEKRNGKYICVRDISNDDAKAK
ncbi:MAG: nuclear transport factor 2 family protein [Ferruginibacter sp.]|nr:nuclear transport factor 2 family protein [Ferruginibacter sp.]